MVKEVFSSLFSHIYQTTHSGISPSVLFYISLRTKQKPPRPKAKRRMPRFRRMSKSSTDSRSPRSISHRLSRSWVSLSASATIRRNPKTADIRSVHRIRKRRLRRRLNISKCYNQVREVKLMPNIPYLLINSRL